VFHRRAQGGGSSTRTLLTLAVLIVANVYGPALGGALGFSGSAAGAVGSALITVGGQLAINALVPLDASNSANQVSQSPTYSTSVQGNQARLGQPIPVLYGHNRTYPDFACRPHQTFVDNDQYYSAVLCVGMGYYDVLRVDIDDTPVDMLNDVEYLIIGPGQADGETLADQTLVKTNIITNVEAANQDMVSLKAIRFTVVPRGREAIALGVDVALPRGLDSGRTVTWRVQARTVNDVEQPTSGWVTLADESYSTASGTPPRLSYRYEVDAGRYQVQLYRTDIRATEASAAHDLSLIGLTCELDEDGIDTTIPATYVVLKMRGSQQLNGISQSRIRVLSNRKLPVWNGSAWSAPQVTRSIAWAAADILRDSDYGRDLDDDQIDLTTLLALDSVFSSAYDKYDGAFDTSLDTWSAISQVMRVGRAVPLIRGSRYTFVRDVEDTEPVALFGMRNIRKGSFSLQLAVPELDEVTALDIEYWDQTRWDWVTRTVQYEEAEDPPFIAYTGDVAPSPYTRAENVARIKMPGAIGPQHVSRIGAYTLADMLFRRSRANYRAHLDGLLPAYGAPVLIAHDVPNWGQSGDVVDWDGVDTVTTSEPLDFSSGTHYMRLQMASGGVQTWEVTAGAEPNEAIVVDPDGFTPSFESANKDRTRYSFGPSTNMGALCRMRAIIPRGQRDIEHQVVLDDVRVYEADETWRVDDDPISDGTSGPAEGSDILVVRLLDRTVTADASEAGIHLLDNGLAQESTNTVASNLANEWMQGGMIDSTVAALYEVRATQVALILSGDGYVATGTLDAWLQLGVAQRDWSVASLAGDGVADWTLFFEIRIISTSEVQDTATIRLVADTTDPGGE
jgi:hypothetical protein